MKNFFKLVSVSALAAAVYGVPVANANTATPEACVANDLTLTFDLTAIDAACRGESSCSRVVQNINEFLADRNVSVGQSVRMPSSATYWPFVYTLNGVDYQPGQAITIPATTANTITVQVELGYGFASMRSIVLKSNDGRSANIGLAFFDEDNEAAGISRLIYDGRGGAIVDMTQSFGPVFGMEVSDTLATMGYAPDVIDTYLTPRVANQTFRGFANNNEEMTLPVVSADAVALAMTYPLGIGIGDIGSDAFNFGKTLALKMTYSENASPYYLVSAFAQNCDAETTVTACDTSNPTKPICTLGIGPDGSVTYNNGCCTGYSLPDATTTE